MMSPRERKIAIVTSLVIGALALDRVFISPLWARQAAAQQRVADATEALGEANNLYDNELRARRRWKQMAGETLAHAAPQAEGQVLNSVRDWAQRAGVSLTSLKPERTEQRHGFGVITIRAVGTGRMQAVSRLLYAIETGDVPLRVTDVSVAARREGADELTVQVGLATIYLPPGEPASLAGSAVAGRTDVRTDVRADVRTEGTR